MRDLALEIVRALPNFALGVLAIVVLREIVGWILKAQELQHGHARAEREKARADLLVAIGTTVKDVRGDRKEDRDHVYRMRALEIRARNGPLEEGYAAQSTSIDLDPPVYRER